MKRSGGVTAAAVVALLGSAGLGLVAVSELSGALFISRFHPGGQALPEEGVIPAVASMVMGSLFNLAFAGWGLATGVALIRLKPWSRISTLVYAGLTGVCASFAGLIILFVPIPGPASAGQNFSGIFRVALELFLAIPFSIAIWWLILFTRKSVVAQFSGTPGPEVAAQVADTAAVPVAGTPPPQRPMIITILAWFFLVSAISSVPRIFGFYSGP